MRDAKNKLGRGETREVYSFLSAREGGPNRAWLLADLKKAGIKARPVPSCYVGNVGIEVTGGKRAQRKAEKLIFG
jgi:hypothetical protein